MFLQLLLSTEINRLLCSDFMMMHWSCCQIVMFCVTMYMEMAVAHCQVRELQANTLLQRYVEMGRCRTETNDDDSFD